MHIVGVLDFRAYPPPPPLCVCQAATHAAAMSAAALYAAAVCTGPVLLPQHLPPHLRELPAKDPDAPLIAALATWLDARLAEKATYRQIHDAIESMALRHLLAHFDGKPTILARETGMNRVTLRKKVGREID